MVVDLLLVLEALKARRLYALGNECVSTSRQTDLEERSDRTGQVQRGGVCIRAAVIGQLSAEEMQELRLSILLMVSRTQWHGPPGDPEPAEHPV